MDYVLWILILITLCPVPAACQSGDDASPDDESVLLSCSSTISFTRNLLICDLEAEDVDDFEYAQLCYSGTCVNGTKKNYSIYFQNLNLIKIYELQTHFRDGTQYKQTFKLETIVKLPTPAIHNITYDSNGAFIHIAYKHDYVHQPDFQMEIWREGDTDKKNFTVKYQLVNIDGHNLRDSYIYYARVRAKPVGYFKGRWTDWSPAKSLKGFRVKEPPFVIYIIICSSLIVVVGFGWWLILRWKKVIQAYISPNIPNPKATLAQMQREKEHPPVSFSPEIFNDVKINWVVYAEEKQLNPELAEDQEDASESSQSEVEASQPDLQPEEISHLKIRLLDQSEEEENVVGCQNQTAMQRNCKDESYVTMSSLYKTQ